jgi:hypothetical protein
MPNQRTLSVLSTAALVMSLAGAAAAHPGHGLAGGSQSALHYLGEPLHVAPFVLAALALGLAARRRSRARLR